MTEPLGPYLRRERERRGLTLRTISERTKISVGLFEGLEADDISRWPGGIFRRAFVRSYAECVGLDGDEVVKRFERQYPPPEPQGASPELPVPSVPAAGTSQQNRQAPPVRLAAPVTDRRARVLGTAADLTVAVILALGSAAAGSRLLWPVLLIAGYYAIGILLTGTSPMVALLREHASTQPASPGVEEPSASTVATRPPAERRHQPRRTNERPRQRRGLHAHP